MSDTVSIAVPSVGDQFPEIAVQRPDGSEAIVTGLLPKGRSAVVFFMRSSDCPVCHAHIRALQRMADAGDLGDAGVVIVVPGEPVQAAEVQRRTSFPVVASGEAHRRAGLGRSLLLQHSGTFVLDADRRVRARRTSPLPTASFSRSEVSAALAR